MPNLHLILQNDDGEPRTIDTPPLDETDAIELLANAEFAGSQLVPWGSNYTFAVLLEAQTAKNTWRFTSRRPANVHFGISRMERCISGKWRRTS